MDIIDVMLARAMTPQGKTETYVAKANAAAAKAEKAKQDAAEAIATVNAAAEAIAEKQEAADALLETSQLAQLNLPNSYSITGQNTDGYMTLKAVTDELDTKATIIYVNNSLSNKVDNSTLNNYATTAYVNQQIAAIPSSGGSSAMPAGVSNLGIDNAGKIVIIGPDGNITSGDINEESIIQVLIQAGLYTAEGTIGLSIDYANKSTERIQDAVTYRAGSDFNTYAMYGGRMRCNVADDGTINAFYGDNGYIEDGSNGLVMIYQPKFYYQRAFLNTEKSQTGNIIRKELIILSDKARSGFMLHPLFKNGDVELDYVLLPAYEGSIYDVDANIYMTNNGNNIQVDTDKLSSIAGVKPFSGINKNLTIEDVRQLALNRGEGWQLTNLAFESALQMLAIVELGTMNGQTAIEKGIINVSRNNATDCSAVTGSTSTLGNNTGFAPQTIYDRDGTRVTYNAAGSRAISYRGMENPWGNLWRLIGDMSVRGNGQTLSGIPYCNETALGFLLPYSSNKWISAMGYYNNDYLWAYLPIECSDNANSAVPVGDALWTQLSLNGVNILGVGGMSISGDASGLFFYCADINSLTSLRYFNGRIMYIPEKNSIYNANIAKWRQHYGG